MESIATHATRRAAMAREAACVAAYAALTVLMTYPLALRGLHAIPGSDDAWQFYWNIWWIRRAVIDLHTTPYFTHDLFHPYGADLHFHTLNLLPGLLAIP